MIRKWSREYIPVMYAMYMWLKDPPSPSNLETSVYPFIFAFVKNVNSCVRSNLDPKQKQLIIVNWLQHKKDDPYKFGLVSWHVSCICTVFIPDMWGACDIFHILAKCSNIFSRQFSLFKYSLVIHLVSAFDWIKLLSLDSVILYIPSIYHLTFNHNSRQN